MLITDLLARLQGSQLVELLASAKDSIAKTEPIRPTQPVLAKVEAQLPDGSFKVIVDGQSVQVNLPSGTRTGDIIEFHQEIPQANTEAKQTPTSSQNPVTTANLSEAARLIASLSQQKATSTSTTATQAPPALREPSTDVNVIANTLRHLLEGSGLFYESHQAQWTQGRRELAQLLSEPQGRFSPALQTQKTEKGTSEKPVNIPTQLTVTTNTVSPKPVETGPERNTPTPSSSLQTQLAETTLDPRTAHLVQQQLTSLEHNQFIWRGELWPKQWIEWTIDEQPTPEGSQEAEQTWQTNLRLNFLRLGEVTATLRLTQQGLKIELHSKNDETTKILRDAQESLVQAMTADGINTLSVNIKDNPEKT